MAKDAKGHGSEGRGGSSQAKLDAFGAHGAMFNVDPKTGVTPSQKAIAAREMFGSHSPISIAAAHGIDTSHLSMAQGK